MAKTPTQRRKIRILAYGDSPVTPSGFGTVMRNVFQYLGNTGRYEIDIWGINDRGAWLNPGIHPYHVYRAYTASAQDPYGLAGLVDVVRGSGLDLTPPWDIVFFLQDPFVLERPLPYFNLGALKAIRDIQKTLYVQLAKEEWFRTIAYWPVDSAIKPHWVQSAIGLADTSVAYTKYGKAMIERANIQLDKPIEMDDIAVIYHGNNFSDFYPLKPAQALAFRREFFRGQVRDETFLVLSVARNQQRKDIPRTLRIFKEFQRRRPDSYLYVHAQDKESWGSLKEVARELGLRQHKDWNCPEDFVAAKGYTEAMLNHIYNAADVFLSTTQGEGWGLPITEAMATKTIVMAPNITSIPEIFNTTKLDAIDDMNLLVTKTIRGIPLLSGSTSSEWIMHGAHDMERVRPLTNVDDAVQKLLWVYDHPDEVKKIVNRGYQWISKLSWESIGEKWDTLFTNMFEQLERDRADELTTRKRWAQYELPR